MFLRAAAPKASGHLEHGMMATSLPLSNLDRLFYECKLHTCGFTLDDVGSLAIHVVGAIATKAPVTPPPGIYLPEFIDLIVALAATKYPNPFDDVAQRLQRFLTRDMQLTPNNGDVNKQRP